ncbi:MAG: Gfo/Idh/MocA family oxidoreductase [Anaerolineaceae bacterium]|nr:Gfo/Idh/MocA family oxidoreductase [Anaerolineaceae bacterium]
MTKPTVRFATIGINHGHIYGQTDLMRRAGAEHVSVYAKEADLLAQYTSKYDDIKIARSEAEILEDESIDLVISAGINCERAPLGIRVMRHGKDYMSDKPGITSLKQLDEVRKAQAETKQIYSICFSERLEQPATVRAGEMVKAGMIGDVIETVGLGPHRTSLSTRPAWYFKRAQYGGILTDIGSHQMDQFLYFSGAKTVEILKSQVGNFKHPQYPELEDYGDVLLRADTNTTGYVRVDWYTPDGLDNWGDGRLFVLGTEGYIELRKYTDVTRRNGGDHLYWVNKDGMHYEDCKNVDLPYGRQLVYDIVNRTETAVPQWHTFYAMELALRAEAMATRSGNLQPDWEGKEE